jgi:hypothetical protein
MKFLNDNVDPRFTKSKTDIELPHRSIPYSDMEEPYLAKLRSDIEEPMWT